MAYTDPISQKQIDFIASLLDTRVHGMSATMDDVRRMTRKDASRLIGRLLPLPKVAAPIRTLATPAPMPLDAENDPRIVAMREARAMLTTASKGFYAVPDPSRGSRALTFVQIRKAYRRETLQLVGLTGAPGAFNRRMIQPQEQVRILKEIALDPLYAMMMFADHYAVCGKCAAELTDATSRERKFGPDCWKQLRDLGILPKGS